MSMCNTGVRSRLQLLLCNAACMRRAGQNGVTVKKTVSALVVGFYGEGVQPGDGNTVVENLGDYLAGQGI